MCDLSAFDQSFLKESTETFSKNSFEKTESGNLFSYYED